MVKIIRVAAIAALCLMLSTAALAGTVTIASGTSLSGALVIGPDRPIAIGMPAAWTAASLTFEVSFDGGATWGPMYDKDGTEYTVVTDATRRIPLPPMDWAGITNLKIRSGTAAVPVNQGADRVITMVTRIY